MSCFGWQLSRMALGLCWRLSSRRRSRRYFKPAPSRSRGAPTTAPEAPDDAVVVGRVIRSHGLDGAIRIRSHSDNPTRFQAGSELTIAGQIHTVVSCRDLPGGDVLLRLEGLNDSHTARRLADEWILAPVNSAPELPPGEYYHYQLVGLTVITDQGENLGAVREVLQTGSNDVYVVASNTGAEILLPAIEQVVQEIDLASRTMLVHLIAGLR